MGDWRAFLTVIRRAVKYTMSYNPSSSTGISGCGHYPRLCRSTTAPEYLHVWLDLVAPKQTVAWRDSRLDGWTAINVIP